MGSRHDGACRFQVLEDCELGNELKCDQQAVARCPLAKLVKALSQPRYLWQLALALRDGRNVPGADHINYPVKLLLYLSSLVITRTRPVPPAQRLEFMNLEIKVGQNGSELSKRSPIADAIEDVLPTQPHPPESSLRGRLQPLA